MSLSRIGKKLLTRSHRNVQQTRAISHLVDDFSSTLTRWSRSSHAQKQPVHSAAAAHSTRALSYSAPYSRETFLEIPRNLTLRDKIKFLADRVPIGFMDEQHIGFCHQCLFNLSAQKTGNMGHQAERILERLELEASIRGSEGILSAAEYARVIRALARTDETVDGETDTHPPPFRRAKAILDRMIDRHMRKPNEHPAPDIYVYNGVLFACSRTKHHVEEALELALDILHSLEQNVLESGGGDNNNNNNNNNNSMTVIPTATTYNNVFHLYSKIAGKVYGAATAAEDLLMHFSKLSADGLLGNAHDSRPDTFTFNSILSVWGESVEDKGADRALEILQFMLGIGAEDKRVQPDVMSFVAVINAFARRQRPEEATAVYQQAIEFFSQRHQEQKSSEVKNEEKEWPKKNEVIDLTGCFNSALSAWAGIGNPDRAEVLFRDAQNYSIQQGHGIEQGFRVVPDHRSYRSVVNSYLASSREDAIDKAHQYLKNMILAFQKGKGPPPDREIFHSVLWEFSGNPKRPRAAMDAEELLHFMMRLSQDHQVECSPLTSTFARCIRLWTKQPYTDTSTEHVIQLFKLAEKRRLLNRSIYEIVINFLAEPSSSTQAALILECLPPFMKSELMSDQLPGMALFTKTLRALAKVKSAVAAEHSMRLLRLMQDLKLPITARTYTIVVSAFSKEKTETAADIVCLLLEELKQADADPNSEIRFMDSLIFTIVLEVLGSVGTKKSAEKACEVLNDMFQMYSAGRPEVEPDERSLDACLNALCVTKDINSTKRAVQLLAALSTKTKANGDIFLPSRRGILNVLNSCLRDGLEEEARRVRTFFGISSSEGPLEKSRALRVSSLLRRNQPGGLDKADQLLREMIVAFEDGKGHAPNPDIFHSVIGAWCNSRDKPQAGIKAEELLRSMIRLNLDFGAPTAPSVSAFARCIIFWTKQPHNPTSVDRVTRLFSLAEEHHAVSHNIYENTIQFLAKPSSAMQAAVILERFPSHVESGLLKVEEKRTPPLFTKTIVALGKVKSRVASDQALKLLRLMQDIGIQPHVFTYTSVIASLTHDYFRREYAAEVACSLFEEFKQVDADPDKISRFADPIIFEIVLAILSFAKTKSCADKACAVLNDMFQLYASGRPELEPTARCLENCLKALYATGDKAYIHRAVQLFFTMASKINSKGFQYLPPAKAVHSLAKSCSEAGLELESEKVLNFWKSIENRKVA